jgi:hypothetical protein
MDVAQIEHKDVSYIQSKTRDKNKSANSASFQTTSEISEISKNLSNMNINLPDSKIDSSGDSVSFNLKFLKESSESYSLEGYCSKDFTKGEFSLKFDYLMENGKDSKSVLQYKAELSLSFTSFNNISISFSEEKEDIFDFLNRITRDIFKKLNDGKTNISSFMLDFEDMKDINAISDKKIVRLIYHLIEMIKAAIEAKKMTNKHSLGRSVVYNPHRIIKNTFQTSISSACEIKCSFSANAAEAQKSSA